MSTIPTILAFDPGVTTGIACFSGACLTAIDAVTSYSSLLQAINRLPENSVVICELIISTRMLPDLFTSVKMTGVIECATQMHLHTEPVWQRPQVRIPFMTLAKALTRLTGKHILPHHIDATAHALSYLLLHYPHLESALYAQAGLASVDELSPVQQKAQAG